MPPFQIVCTRLSFLFLLLICAVCLCISSRKEGDRYLFGVVIMFILFMIFIHLHGLS